MKTKQSIRKLVLLFMAVLFASGLTAFPLRAEMAYLVRWNNVLPDYMAEWLSKVNDAVQTSPDLLLYGTDWLAFAHLVIALFFIPVYLDPLRYQANISVGISACLLVFPLAFCCGHLRSIPFFHQLIDCSFGLFGAAFLFYIKQKIKRLEVQQHD